MNSTRATVVGQRLVFSMVLGLLVVLASAPARAQEALLGTLLSLTGDLAAYGEPLKNASDLAADQINAQGGVRNGAFLRLVHRDDQTSPQPGVEAAQRLVSVDRVPAFVGALSSGVTIPVATSVAVPNRVVQISPASTSPEITNLDDDDYLFRTVPSDALQGKVLAQVAQEQGYKAVSVVYINNAYGEGLARNFQAAFEAGGGRVLVSVAMEGGQASYRGELQRAARGNPEALVLIAYPENGATVLRQAVEEGFFRAFLFSDGLQSEDLVAAVGAQALEGTHGTSPLPPTESPAYQLFRDAYAKKYGTPPPQPYMPEAYDGTFVLALAMEKAGPGATGQQIRDALREVANAPGEVIHPGEWAKAKELIARGVDVDYQGASGPVEFDENGDVVNATYGVWKFEGGRIVQVRTVEI
ncbi:ABC transporter substrate-binding protein [Limnochorda pilosa]|uniref:Amino acid ABC transporter substrate-binding protein n=1 Tax=Limnochorda pilosa TaxID=1555112 RepID=A0A0K2SGV2_LIMPI|nr:ABC transporter substrate-binding protein [Limnochorda pilosa]BAS26064.1 amino acid ABC transporter substrate-binding protein [Limnochorda pilosa]